MSMDMGKVKSVLAGEKHEVSLEEHKYVLQCMLKQAYEEDKTLEEQKEAVANILTYVINSATVEAGETKETPEALLSLLAIRTIMFRSDLRKILTELHKLWAQFSSTFINMVDSNIDETLAPLAGPYGLMEFSDVELPA